MNFDFVIKRDGREVPFDLEKIKIAILKAGKVTKEFDEPIAGILSKIVEKNLQITKHIATEKKSIPLEDIQDTVERVLLNSEFTKTAKAFIIYREQRARTREIVTTFHVDMVDKYVNKSDWKVKENSNTTFSLQGLHNYMSNEQSAQYWLNKIYPKEVRDAHVNGDFHIHDLGMLATYCCGWDLQDFLLKGFTGVPNKVSSDPPKHFRTALGQLVNLMFTLQAEAAGAQAVSNFDTLLAPFVKYDNLNYKQVKQAIQEFIFNMNISTRVGFQTPFSNVTMDLKVPSTFANERVIHAGVYKEDTYSMFQNEMNMINKAFVEIMINGDSSGRIFTFPIPTYSIDEDFDWEDPLYDPVFQVAGKYGLPYFANYVNSDMSPEDARSMCCRLRIDNRELRKRGGGLFGASPKTGSLGVVTINLPRIGYLSNSEEEFLTKLDDLLYKAKLSLILKRKTVDDFTEKGMYPYSAYYLADTKARFGSCWANHFNTIGIIGMEEACQNLFSCSIGDLTGKEFSLRVMDHIRNRMVEFQEETGLLFNLEATPAESTSYSLALKDKEKYPNIITAIGGDGDCYYTNSTHLPVHFTDDMFDLLDLQDELQSKYTGGTVIHFFLGEEITDPNVVKSIVRKICTNYKLPYFSLTPTFSTCDNHGYLPGKQECCPTCGGETEIFSRIVGYYRPIKSWNQGKVAEFGLRKTFKINE